MEPVELYNTVLIPIRYKLFVCISEKLMLPEELFGELMCIYSTKGITFYVDYSTGIKVTIRDEIGGEL